MPTVEQSGNVKIAVYWEISGRDRFADPTFLPPREIPCRWEHVHFEMNDPSGDKVTIEARVSVNEKIKDDSLLYLGTLEQWYGVGSGSGNEGNLLQVVRYNQAEDVRGQNVRREALLNRYRKKP